MNERERIEYIINSYGLSPSQFADRTGIPRASVSHILSGRNKPSLEVFQKVATVFPEVDVQWLMLGIGKEPQLSSASLAAEGSVQEAIFTEEAQLFKEYDEQMGSVQPEPVKQPSLVSAFRSEKPAQRQLQQSVDALTQKHEEQQRVSKSVPRSAQQQRRSAPQRTPEQGRRIKEIRVFYSDGTFEILFPEK